MLKSLAVILAMGVTLTTGILEEDCLFCMCFVSSTGCEMPDPVCANNGGSVVCGPWAITEGYWQDGGYQGGTFTNCVQDWDCNENTVRAYLDRYVTDPTATCETYARTHFGGPFGSGADYTLNYWYQVRNCLDYDLFTPPPVDEK
ncbi:hypothetical protein SK128_012541 [Halocaridina rubra]|uniref:lysozyme n=1 Tax=Halocaridina rubra TaxID=373956 RepID=A0AAN9AGC6_HALRR